MFAPQEQNRMELSSTLMPTSLIKEAEAKILFSKASWSEISPMLANPYSNTSQEEFNRYPLMKKLSLLKGIDETLRNYLPLRESAAGADLLYNRRELNT